MKRGPPSLFDICILASASGDLWQLQTRRMAALPEDAANRLLAMLLCCGRLCEPSALQVFRHAASELSIPQSVPLSPQWMSYVAGLSQLRSLTIAGTGRLRDGSLTSLTRLANSLTLLDLQRCPVSNRGLTGVLPALRRLRSLNLAAPLLMSLAALTHLDLGGCDLEDADIAAVLPSLPALAVLVLRSTGAADCTVASLSCLSALRSLDMEWSACCRMLPLLPSLSSLNLSHCTLGDEDSAWQAAQSGATPSGLTQLLLGGAVIMQDASDALTEAIRLSSASLQLLHASMDVRDPLPLLLLLGSAQRLTALAAGMPRLSDDMLPALAACCSLTALDLAGAGAVSAAGLATCLPQLTALQRLRLRGQSIDDGVLPLLARMPRLHTLVLEGSRVAWDWLWLPPQLPQQQCSGNGSGSSVVKSCGSEQHHDGGTAWRSLRVLELPDSAICSTGATNMAAQLAAAATLSGGIDTLCASVAAAPGSQSSSGIVQAAVLATAGLHTLDIGSSAPGTPLGRRQLAALVRISSLQQLTLRRWQLQDADLALLQALPRLRVLELDSCSQLLLSDSALANLVLEASASLPRLRCVVRDGRVLAATPPWPHGDGAVLCALRHGGYGTWLAHMAAADGTAASTGPLCALLAAAPPRVAFSNTRSGTCASSSSAGSRSMQQRHNSAVCVVSDERHRYTAQHLLALRPTIDVGATSVSIGGSTSEGGLGDLPAELLRTR